MGAASELVCLTPATAPTAYSPSPATGCVVTGKRVIATSPCWILFSWRCCGRTSRLSLPWGSVGGRGKPCPSRPGPAQPISSFMALNELQPFILVGFSSLYDLFCWSCLLLTQIWGCVSHGKGRENPQYRSSVFLNIFLTSPLSSLYIIGFGEQGVTIVVGDRAFL